MTGNEATVAQVVSAGNSPGTRPEPVYGSARSLGATLRGGSGRSCPHRRLINRPLR